MAEQAQWMSSLSLLRDLSGGLLCTNVCAHWVSYKHMLVQSFFVRMRLAPSGECRLDLHSVWGISGFLAFCVVVPSLIFPEEELRIVTW